MSRSEKFLDEALNTGAEAYLHAKFNLDPSNRLATVHQRHRQTGQTTIWFASGQSNLT